MKITCSEQMSRSCKPKSHMLHYLHPKLIVTQFKTDICLDIGFLDFYQRSHVIVIFHYPTDIIFLCIGYNSYKQLDSLVRTPGFRAGDPSGKWKCVSLLFCRLCYHYLSLQQNLLTLIQFLFFFTFSDLSFCFSR